MEQSKPCVWDDGLTATTTTGKKPHADMGKDRQGKKEVGGEGVWWGCSKQIDKWAKLMPASKSNLGIAFWLLLSDLKINLAIISAGTPVGRHPPIVLLKYCIISFAHRFSYIWSMSGR